MLFVTAPVIAFVVGKFNALIVSGTKRAQERIADLSSNLVEVLQNERIVKAFRREDFERDRFAGANERYFGAYMKVTQFNQTQAPVLASVVMIALCAVIALTAREVSVGHLSPATAFGFWTATGLLINPMNRFSIFFADFARAFVGAGRVFEILDLPVEPDDPPGAVALPDRSPATCGSSTSRSRTTRTVRCCRTSRPRCCTARSSRWSDRRAPARARSSTWCRASTSRRSAASRSTAPTSRTFGWATCATRSRSCRRRRSSSTARSPTTSATAGSTRATTRCVAAAREANADEFVRRLPDGYGTLVGERGIRLSGGQRQRLAIARAILRDPRILILDEATSALDSHSEALIEDALDRLLPGRTTLIIAHRLSTIRRATKILYIEAGVVRETGTHESLIAAGGPYADLHAAQFAR